MATWKHHTDTGGQISFALNDDRAIGSDGVFTSPDDPRIIARLVELGHERLDEPEDDEHGDGGEPVEARRPTEAEWRAAGYEVDPWPAHEASLARAAAEVAPAAQEPSVVTAPESNETAAETPAAKKSRGKKAEA